MEPGASDPGTVRETIHAQWDFAATGWRRWSDFQDRVYAHVGDRLVALAGVRPGSRVLDVATGYGEPALTAARLAGPEGKVVATDISAEMLAFGRERPAAAGLDNVEFLESDAMSLDFEPGSFDAAVSRWGIIFEPEAEAAAARIRGFLVPGSRMAICSFGRPEEVPFISLPMRVSVERAGATPPPPGTPGPLSRPTPDALAALLEGGGFTDVAVEKAEVVFDFDSPEHFTEFIKAIAAPVIALVAQLQPKDRDAAWDAITEAAADFGGGSGPLRLRNAVLLASGVA